MKGPHPLEGLFLFVSSLLLKFHFKTVKVSTDSDIGKIRLRLLFESCQFTIFIPWTDVDEDCPSHSALFCNPGGLGNGEVPLGIGMFRVLFEEHALKKGQIGVLTE